MSKIKIKGTICYISKVPNEFKEYFIYECLNNTLGNIIGKKTADGKYMLGLLPT